MRLKWLLIAAGSGYREILMAPPSKGHEVQAIESLARSVEQQWTVAGLGPLAIANEVLQRAIQALNQAKLGPKHMAKAANALTYNRLPLTTQNFSSKREARMRVAAVKIYGKEYRRVSRRGDSAKKTLPKNPRKTLELTWDKTQTQLFRKFGIKAPDFWKYEIFPSVEKQPVAQY